MKVARNIVLLLLFFAVAATAAFAQDPVGELELTKGVVKVRRGERDLYFRKLEERTPIFAGDELHSGKDTRADIIFRDGREKIQLYSRSLFKVEEVSERRSFFGISIGKVFFKVLSKLRRNKFTVQTPTATIGVKGTEFVVATDGAKTFVFTQTGVVALANVDFPDKEVLVEPNQASSVDVGTAPAPPIIVEQEDQDAIIEQEGTETFEALPLVPPPPEPVEEQGQSEEEEEETTEEQLAPPKKRPGDFREIVNGVSESVESVRPSSAVGAIKSSVKISVTR